MIIRNLFEEQTTDRHVVSENWESTRLLLRKDGLGFSFHITTIHPETETAIWYKYHFESVYCIEGTGEIELVEDGSIYDISPGTIYILDQHDQHLLRAHTRLTLACVFNPPCEGDEMHDDDGAYLLAEGQSKPLLEAP